MNQQEIEVITTSKLDDIRKDPTVTIVDVRSVDAYNGWREAGESRGGHIPGARSLPAKWTDYIDWIEIVRKKGFTPEQTFILYGYDKTSVEKVAHAFVRTGHSNVRIYPHFIEEWCGDAALPMEHLTRYRHLVSPQWLKGLITKGESSEYDGRDFVICHAHYRNPSAYDTGHIPGAVSLDTNLLESQDTWNRRTPEELKEALESLGITWDTTVILYGRFLNPDNADPFPASSAGHLGAMRCAFIMMYAGVQDVRILNGGMQSWIDAGFEVSKKGSLPVAVQDFGIEIPAFPALAVDLDEAREMTEADDMNLVSVRSWKEYIGEVSGYNYIEKKGRIKGSVFANCGSDAYHMENYRNLDHTIREYHEVEREWIRSGITPEKHNAFYCGTGWRGSEAFFNAWLMGWPRVSVFDGGWFEWSNNDYPSEVGSPYPQSTSE